MGIIPQVVSKSSEPDEQASKDDISLEEIIIVFAADDEPFEVEPPTAGTFYDPVILIVFQASAMLLGLLSCRDDQESSVRYHAFEGPRGASQQRSRTQIATYAFIEPEYQPLIQWCGRKYY